MPMQIELFFDTIFPVIDSEIVANSELLYGAEVISDKRVAVIGYGNQGRAHALNLRHFEADTLDDAPRRNGAGKSGLYRILRPRQFIQQPFAQGFRKLMFLVFECFEFWFCVCVYVDPQ